MHIDVVVVGGGASGLAVANGLVQEGLTTALFEARTRLGGRIETRSIPGGRADLGATWFWPGERRVHALVDQLGLATHQQWLHGDALVWDRRGISRLSGNPIDMPCYRISNGVDGLIDGLAQRLPAGTVLLDSPVKRVRPEPHGLTIELAEATCTARGAVIAMPPSLALRSGVVHAEDLAPGLAQIAGDVPVWMGSTVKYVALYERPFWREEGLAGAAYCPGQPLHEIHDMSGPDGSPAMLFGFGSPNPLRPISPAEILEQLGALFGAAARTPARVLFCDWGAERATSPKQLPNPDRLDLFGSSALTGPTWDNRLWWSSTETSTVAPGHIEGALAAAERTVASITQHLRPL